MPLVPCIWVRIRCHGQVDADGLKYNGCGDYNVAGPDRIALLENYRKCGHCGGKNIEVMNYSTGQTTHKFYVPTSIVRSDTTGFEDLDGKPRHRTTRKAYLDGMGDIMGQPRRANVDRKEQRKPGTRERKVTQGRHIVRS